MSNLDMTRKLLYSKDAADYCEVSNSYLMNQAKMGRVAYVQTSPKKILFDKHDLDKWMASWRRVEVHAAS